MGAALIFVAYEGFELIPNAVNEMENPRRNLTRGIFWSIGITISVYVLVSLVAVGNLTPDEIHKYGEYALAVAAKPFLGQAGFLLRLGKVMAQERELPAAFAFVRQSKNIPWFSLIVITGVTLAFVNLGDLTIIASFSSSTFLLIFLAINLSAWRLRRRIGIHPAWPLLGMLSTLAAWLTLVLYLWQTSRDSLAWLGAGYLAVILAELLFSRRRIGTLRQPDSLTSN